MGDVEYAALVCRGHVCAFDNPATCGIVFWRMLNAFASQTQDLIDHIPIILPPLLILMDDYKSSYRIRGLQILPAFLHIPPHVLHRTGIALLLLRSIQHSISLHPTPPEPPLLEISFERLFDLLHVLYPAGQGKEAEAAKQVEEAVEKGIINGWAYAKSGQEGVEALVGVAKAVGMVCREVDLGVIRWMRVCYPEFVRPPRKH